MGLMIRSAAIDEEQKVAALWRACDLVSGPKDPIADFRFAKASPSADVLVAVDESNELKASVMVGHDGHRGWLYYVASDPDARGMGLGRKMVDSAVAWLTERNVEKAQLLVLESNQKVISFYEHLGFEITPRVLMSKFLR